MGDAIDYPGSPAQWFAIPPVLYDEFKKWRDGDFATLEGDYRTIDDLGAYFQCQFQKAADGDESKKALLMTRAVLETLYGGGFHPGVELTWPMRHEQMYAENILTYKSVETPAAGLFGLREIRVNAATPQEQSDVFFNDFGFRMTPDDIRSSMRPDSSKSRSWLWKITPGDLTKWMGIPWQSDAGSCQAVFVKSQYPVPTWWAANLPVFVLPEASYEKLLDPTILDDTKRNIYANRLAWLDTADTGFVGYHAEAGYLNGLINMVYKWDEVGMVTGREVKPAIAGIPCRVYVAYSGNNGTS